jgi:hypothetical protein
VSGGVSSQTQEIVSPQYKGGAARMEHVSSTSQILKSGKKMDAERPRQMSEMNDNTNEQQYSEIAHGQSGFDLTSNGSRIQKDVIFN